MYALDVLPTDFSILADLINGGISLLLGVAAFYLLKAVWVVAWRR